MRKQTFTKRLALELLAVPPRDGLARPIGERDVSKIMRAMLGGWWKWDAAPPIRIGTDGACYDGRHRLTALSRLDKVEMKAWVDDDVDPGDFIYYDTGRPRTGAVMTMLAGHTMYAGQITAAANYVNILNGKASGNALHPYEREQLILSDEIFEDVDIHALASRLNKEFDIPQAGASGTLIWLVQHDLAPEAKVIGIYEELLADTYGDESIARALAELVSPPNRDRAGNLIPVRGKRKERHLNWVKKSSGHRRSDFTTLLVSEIWKRTPKTKHTPQGEALIQGVIDIGSGSTNETKLSLVA